MEDSGSWLHLLAQLSLGALWPTSPLYGFAVHILLGFTVPLFLRLSILLHAERMLLLLSICSSPSSHLREILCPQPRPFCWLYIPFEV